MPSLFVIRGNDQGTRFELEERTVRVGRDVSSDIQLHDTEVSRHHAEIRWGDRTHAILDLNSSNGTFVNGTRVRHHVLASGDQVQLGGTLMLYTGPSDEPDEAINRLVAIAPPQQNDDGSRILHSVTQEEGSRIFSLGGEAPPDSWMARARSNLQVMYRTALAISHTLDIDQLLQRIMQLIFEWVECDRGCIMLFDPLTRKLEPRVRRTRAAARSDEKMTLSRTILEYVLEKNEGVLSSDARRDDRWRAAASILQMGVRETICVPMQGRYAVVGVIYIDTFSTPQETILREGAAKFLPDHLKLLIAIAHQAALAVEDTRYYSAMVQAERLAAVGQTIATLSHHIKNILQGIRGGSYLIEMGLNEHDETIVGKGWAIVEKNQKKISALVMDMLTYSKEREPDLAPADLNQVIRDVVELMQSRAQESAVTLTAVLDDAIPTLVFDAEGIHRAVLNVVTNAIDAAAEVERPGTVEVRTTLASDENKVRIFVRDNGPGIPADEIDKVFSPFISSKKSRGTGLGLPVSQKIFTEHGGQIRVESLAGEGCRFILELPAVLPDAIGQTLTGEEEARGEG